MKIAKGLVQARLVLYRHCFTNSKIYWSKIKDKSKIVKQHTLIKYPQEIKGKKNLSPAS